MAIVIRVLRMTSWWCVVCSLSNLAMLLPMTLALVTVRDVQAADRVVDDEAPGGRLPTGVTPVNYVLDLDIDPGAPTFSGTVMIDVALDAPTQRIWLHGRDLNVTHAEVQLGNGEVRVATYAQQSKEGVASLTLAQPLPAGRANLRLQYTARFDEHLAGIYKLRAGNDDYVFSQFEAIDARRAMPCFDEPRFKTPFSISITAPTGMHVFANGAETASNLLANGRTKVTFETTPPLPTYLIALAVGPFDVIAGPPLPPTAMRDRPVRVRGVAVKGKGALLKDALAITPGIVTRLENYFDQPYPFTKLDIVAVPDFASGAMENAALITYRDTILLLDASASPRQRRNLLTTHAHELAHQWVGDLVTPPWWDDVWLNESFANWMQYKISADVAPEEKFPREMQRETLGAMYVDSLASARRIREPVRDNNDIANAFDDITYSKGAGVLVMLEGFVGAERFREGVRHYLRAHAFASATADDLIKAIAESRGENTGDSAADSSGENGSDVGIAAAFASFLDQPGVPLLDVRTSCGRGQFKLSLAQTRYAPLGARAADRSRWKVPVCMRTDLGKACKLLVDSSVTVPLARCPAWVMPNADGAGYYRFRMPRAELRTLLAQRANLSDTEQIALVGSVLAGFRAGDADVGDVLALAETTARSSIREVVTAPLPTLNNIYVHMTEGKSRAALARRITTIYGPAIKALDVLQADQRLLASELIEFVARHGDDKGGDDAGSRRQLAAAAMAFLGTPAEAAVHPTAVDSELLGTALRVAVQDLGAAAFDLIVTKLPHLDNTRQRDNMIGALGAARDPALRQRAMAMLLSGELRHAEVDALTFSLFEDNGDGVVDSWVWLKTHVDALMGLGSTSLQFSLPFVAADFCSESQAQDMKAFFAPRVSSWEGAPRALAQSLEQIELCTALVKAQSASVRRALP